MASILVMERPENWPLEIPGAEVVLARTYLTDPAWSQRRGLKVFNVCRSYRYQSVGYYVSLLAEARGHRPLPSVATIQDLKNPSLVRVLSDDLEQLIQKSLSSLVSDAFTLSIYFGENVAKRYQRLSRQLFNLFPAPLLRAEFLRTEGKLGGPEPSAHRGPGDSGPPSPLRHPADPAVLLREDPAPTQAPRPTDSTWRSWWTPRRPFPRPTTGPCGASRRPRRIWRSERRRITRDDLGRIAEFDGLFIRATTSVNHFTFRFSRRAAAEGLVVIDDPESILRCTNKVFLAELLTRHKIAVPKNGDPPSGQPGPGHPDARVSP